MKLIIAVVFVGVLQVLAALGQDDDRAKTETIIKDLESKLDGALMHADVAAVDGILADDYMETTAQGSLKSKSDVMTIVRTRAAAPRVPGVGPEITVTETKLRIYGTVALLSGMRTVRYQFMEYQTAAPPGQLPAPTSQDQERFTKIYVKINGQWRLFSFQTTTIAKH